MPRKQNTSSDNFNTALPSKLRTLLKDRNVTQQELADYLGKTRQIISKYADGSCAPDWQTIVKIAEFFGVSADYLLGLTECASNNTDLRAVCDYTGLSEKAIQALRGERSSGNVNRDILNFLIENEKISALFSSTQAYLKLNFATKYCIFDDKGNIANYRGTATLDEVMAKRMADGDADDLFAHIVQTETLLSKIVLSDIEDGLRKLKAYLKAESEE